MPEAAGAAEGLAALTAWVAREVGDPSVALRRITTGNRRQLWSAAGSTDPDRARWFVRVQAQQHPADPYTLAREAEIYAALNRVGALVPELRARRDDGSTIVMDAVRGESDIRRLQPDEQQAVIADYLDRLGAVHARSLPELGLADSLLPEGDASTAGCLRQELDVWETMMRTGAAPPDALLEFGLRWLRDNVPSSPSAPVLVHGDAGPGNFLFEDGRVTGMIDWELAHAGDPLEDLGWLMMRGALDHVAGLGQLARDHCRRYDIGADDARLRYFQLTVLWKVIVIRHVAVGDTSVNLGRNLYYRLVHRRLFVQVLAACVRRPEPVVSAAETADTPRSWLYDACLHHVKETALPAVRDDAAATRSLAGLIRVLRYLKVWDTAGPSTRRVAVDQALADAVRHGTVADDAAFDAVAVEVLTEHELCRGLLDADADLRLPGLAD
jgi:aminoglycoside phosphotransferase (APT) family kinase protein